MSDILPDELRTALDELSSTKAFINELETIFAGNYPDDWAKYRELRTLLPGLQETAKKALRDQFTGGGSVEAFNYTFKISRGNKQQQVDTASLLERARERDELAELLEVGFIEYSVKADQIDRLPGEMRAVYGEYVRTTFGTPKVSLPKELL